METPEKIYVHIKEDKVTNTWNSTFIGVHDIEYIRTDAFIEKACEWLKKNATYVHPRKGKEECIVNLTRFRNYMKEE